MTTTKTEKTAPEAVAAATGPVLRGRPFPPGVSGNPGGRPKSAPHMRKRCRDIVDEKVVALWEAELDAHGPHWVKCSELLMAYGYGPPKEVPKDPVEEMTDEELRAALGIGEPAPAATTDAEGDEDGSTTAH